MSTDLAFPAEESPFDAIRHIRPDGSEYWTARDLCHVTEYETWRNFAAAIERAKVSIENAGESVSSHVVAANNVVPRPQGGSVSREDWDLSRYGAYMVLMNGDPRKPRIAEAQAYFAVKTREAETRPALPDITTPSGVLAMAEQFTLTARQLVAEAEKNRVLEAAIERDAPLVAKAEAHTVSDSAIHRQEFAREVIAWGYKQDILIRQEEVMRFLGHIGLFIRGERTDTGHATADALKRGLAFTGKGTAKNGHAWATGKLTARGQDYAWKRITKHVTEHGDLELPRELRGGDPA